MALLGIPLFRYINIEDSEEVLRAIRLTPPDMPIDFILHTPGGLVLASEQIALAIKAHKAKVTIFVPHYAMSGGTLVALAAQEIVMDKNAVLGPIDPQLGEYPAASILQVVERKSIDEIDDRTLILYDMAVKAQRQVRSLVRRILDGKMPPEQADEVTNILTEGRWTHDYPITIEEAEMLKLHVTIDMPNEVYELMRLYPQPGARRFRRAASPCGLRRAGWRISRGLPCRHPCGRPDWKALCR
jgi:ClpP class serine protease